MNWSFAFDPLLSWTWLAVILIPIALIGLAGIVMRQRGAWLRFAALIAIAAALVNPVLLDEEREPLKSVVALIVDRSQSQDIGNRQAETSAALADLQQRLARFPQFDVRVVETGRTDAADERTETRLFGALDGAFRDVPPSRIAGAVMITDGQVHDVPSGSAPQSFQAPLHALITGDKAERDRRIRFENAPRFRPRRQAVADELPRHLIRWRTWAGRRPRVDKRRAHIHRARHHRSGNAARHRHTERWPQHY